ncbi:yacP-like NYN domain protein [[Clostridium] sordellii ATCC 9714]|nr:yacP-like NYN domain protein [[Clostridium] sordellii ATCC 9714] [Paeniclostridium sordellii ATCC 9714]
MKRKINHYLIIDGYNIINAWDDLKHIAIDDLDAAREKLINIIIEYAEFSGQKAIVVFDAYNVKNSMEKVEKRKYITVVYTREHQTADSLLRS